jgi:hypothetical protein
LGEVKPLKQLDNGRLTAPWRADKCHFFSFLDLKIEAFKNFGAPSLILKINIFKFNVSIDTFFKHFRIFFYLNLFFVFLVQNVEYFNSWYLGCAHVGQILHIISKDESNKETLKYSSQQISQRNVVVSCENRSDV